MELLPCFNSLMAKRGTGRPTETEVQAIARRLKAARVAMEIDQATLCARTGIKKTTYNNWELALGAPSRLEARKLRKHLGWTLDYIFEDDLASLPHAIAVKIQEEAA